MNILDQIHLQNPWYRNRAFRPAEEKLPKRNAFDDLWADITNLRQIISISGLRRVGKSTLIKQIINSLLENKTDPYKILYFSFDQPTILEEKDTLEKIITLYLKEILNKDIYKIKQKVYIFLDEIQLIPFWQDIVKRYYDISPNLKFIVSGSASLLISSKSKESLAGRIFEKKLSPLTFSEYKKLSKNRDFEEFLNFGQFPELLDINDNLNFLAYIKNSNLSINTIFTSSSKSDAIKLYEMGATYVIVPEVVAGEHIRHLLKAYGTKGDRLAKIGRNHFKRLIFV